MAGTYEHVVLVVYKVVTGVVGLLIAFTGLSGIVVGDYALGALILVFGLVIVLYPHVHYRLIRDLVALMVATGLVCLALTVAAAWLDLAASLIIAPIVLWSVMALALAYREGRKVEP